MRLSPIEKAVVAHYPLRCHEPLHKLAKVIGAQEHRIRYTIAKLLEAGVFMPTTVVNILALGLKRYTWFISLSFSKEGSRTVFEEALINSESVGFAARLAGDLDYEIGLLARSDTKAKEILADLLATSNPELNSRVFLPRERSIFFQRKYLAARAANEKLTVFTPTESVRTDKIDRQILQILVSDPDTPQRTLAHSVGLSLPAVNKRIQTLKSEGVLGPKIQLVRFERYGGLFYSLLAEIKNWNGDTINLFEQFADG